MTRAIVFDDGHGFFVELVQPAMTPAPGGTGTANPRRNSSAAGCSVDETTTLTSLCCCDNLHSSPRALVMATSQRVDAFDEPEILIAR